MTDEYEWLSLSADETVVWTGGPRLRRILGTVAGAVVLTLLAFGGAAVLSAEPILALSAFPVPGTVVVWGIAVVIGLSQVGVVAAAYLRVDHTDYALTNRRVYRKTGVLSETVTSVGVDRVQNTTLRKDAWGNLFDYGTVAISTAGSGGADLALTDLDDPETFRDKLQEQVRAAAERDDAGEPRRGAGIDTETMDALLDEARRLRAVAERMEEHA